MTTKPAILGTGLNGLVGSKLLADFQNTYDFTNLDLRNPVQPVDITNAKQVMAVVSQSPAQYLVHLAAYTDVTGAWQQSGDKNGSCYQINVEGTRNIVEACKASNKHLIHISTAYVFDGEKTGPYLETDATNPIEWYGQTKAMAEEVVMSSQANWTILRIDQPFRNDSFTKVDTLHRVIDGMKSGKLYPQFADHYFGPTYINDFVKVIDFVIRKNLTGLYHASSGESWTDFEFAKLVQSALNIDFTVQPGSLAQYLQTSNRPYQKNTALSINLLKDSLDFELKSIQEAVRETIL